MTNVKAIVFILQVTFTLTLTDAFTRWIFSSGRVHSLLTLEKVAHTYESILIALNSGGGEETDIFEIIAVLALMLVPSILICRFVSRQLRKLIIKKAQ
jgi:ATP-dependent protease ClpP protease subunit